MSNLYESVNTKLAGQIAKQTVMDSELKFEGVVYQWGAVYLALLMSPIEGVNARIQYLLARRRTNKNRPPTILTADHEEKVNRLWYFKNPKTHNDQDKKVILG